MKTIPRREFVKRGAGALIIGFGFQDQELEAIQGAAGSQKPVTPEELDSWLVIAEDGTVTVYTGRIDMGTGVQTCFMQLVAEELDVPFKDVHVVMGDTSLTPDQGKSTASNNSSRGAQPLCLAAAEAKQILLKLASERLGSPPELLSVQEGVVWIQDDPAKRVTYGELIRGRRLNSRVKAIDPGDFRGPILEGTAPRKSPKDYRVVGRSIPRVDLPSKAAGTFVFVHDVQVPGMVHGRVVRPSSIGANLQHVDHASVQNLPGLIRVVQQGNFVGVVAEREEQAIRAARQLKVSWSGGRSLPDPAALDNWLRKAKVVKTDVSHKGDVDAAMARAVKVIRASYHFPVQLHAMIAPSCAVADVRDGQATVWSGTQWPQGVRRDLAKLLNLPVEKVRLIWVKASGSYGRLACDDAAADAALLSQAVQRPVRVQWMRHDEHGWEPMSPGMALDVKAGLDGEGRITAFDLEDWSPSHATGELGNSLAWRLVGTNPGWGRLTGAGGRHPYEFENDRVVGHYVEELFRAIYLRAPGTMQHTWAVEAFLDEIASALSEDPLAFRRRYLKDSAPLRVLEAAAQKAGWQARPSPQKNDSGLNLVSGRGIAYGEYTGQRAGLVAEVEVNRQTGKIRARKLVVSVMCGRIINPDGLKHQIQGALIQGVSRTLLESVKFNSSRITSLDWKSYPVIRFEDVPEIETVLLDQPDAEPSGAGELAVVPVGAALCNALFDATGVRLRHIPFTPDRVRAALYQ